MHPKTWKELVHIRDAALESLSYNNRNQKFALLLVVRVTELCEDAMNLIEINRFASVPIILRSALESYIDLILVTNSSKHCSVMSDSFYNYKSKKTGSGRKRDAPISDKFKAAHKTPLYNGLYCDLCRHSHGGIESLLRDHTINGEISIGHQMDLNQANIYKCHCILIVSDALLVCSRFFNIHDQLLLLSNLQDINNSAARGEYHPGE